MKRMIWVCLSVILLLTSLSGCGDTDDYPVKDANPVSDFEYEIRDDGTGIAITDYTGTDDTVVIPQKIEGLPVVMIYNGCFAQGEITSVAMPDTVHTIGMRAFAKCTKLQAVRFSQGLQYIGEEAFTECEALIEIDLSMDSLVRIFDDAFHLCTGLQKVTFGENLEVIGDQAFLACTSLQEIILPKNLRELGMYAFGQCLDAQKVFVPKTIERFGEGAFYNMKNLKEIVFEEGLREIGAGSFMLGRLESVTIPASVEKIGESCFSSLPELKTVYFEGDAPELGRLVFDNTEDLTVYYNPNTSGWDTTPLREKYTLVAKEAD